MIQNGDIGTILETTIKDGGTAVDISGASGIVFTANPPGAAVKSFTAAFKTDGTDGVVNYTTVSGDINVSGTWRIQSLVTFSATKILRSIPATLIVGQRLDSA